MDTVDKTEVTGSSGGIFSQGLGVESTRGVAKDLLKCVGHVVVPGMIVYVSCSSIAEPWSLGSGVVQVPATKADRQSFVYMLIQKFGMLRYTPAEAAGESPHHVWVDAVALGAASGGALSMAAAGVAVLSSQLSVGDRVLGVVRRKAGPEAFYLDIGCSAPAFLSALSFEGASKKNKPDLRLGDVIYAAVLQADPDLEVEVGCTDEAGKASGLGILGRHEPGAVGNACGVSGGIMLHCSLELCRRLLHSSTFPLIDKLSLGFMYLAFKRFTFEICVGRNGRIWLTARSPRETMMLANCIAIADRVPPALCLQLADKLV